MASVITTGHRPLIKSGFDLQIKPDALFSLVNPKDYQAFVLPGGSYSYGFDELSWVP